MNRWIMIISLEAAALAAYFGLNLLVGRAVGKKGGIRLALYGAAFLIFLFLITDIVLWKFS